MRYDVRRVRAEEWAALRELRLAALRDPVAHLAFLDTVAAAEARPAAFWQERARSSAAGTTVAQFVALAPTGGPDELAGELADELAGTVTVLVTSAGERDYVGETSPSPSAAMVGVYVPPEHRGGAAIGALLDAAQEWVRDLGLERVRLHVHEHNARAQAAYRRLGYVETGAQAHLGGAVHLELERDLTDEPAPPR
ncbi:GNAT family N-acetyltransferase [Nocardioides sp. zg-536]|uniref:GNAT family N-acetyltransferase n=1 Tax=Nocardioides faecalis TaxID=2803858 RepID=A0A938YAM0_9ACTN|nr:GNAT family N-acetyltransferase [Nocardioides faecalis]MBM9460875.1 GNAT family N-acetyltransferase [Nocardioides faecalis]QVI59296.1 GNAT family N-acetyltransferase [Nocardioides faecalis]